MKSMKKLTRFTLAALVVSSSLIGVGHQAKASSAGQGPQANDDTFAVGNTKNPKNVILLIGDGMGPSFNTAYRYYKNEMNTKQMNPTAFDNHLVGTNRTYPNDPKENVTDSAAAGTAFSTGHKTYNGAISVDENKQPLETVLERAKEKGKATGLVSTAELTDATPAVFASHIDSRDKKDDIAKQFYQDTINGQHKVDVLLGGGAKYFGKDNGNLDNKFAKDGYDVVSNKQELANSQKNQVLGLFADENMPLAIDAPAKNPSLADMQQSALNKLSQDQDGFFLMVEGASIDKAAHSNDITGVMSEMEGFEKAFDQAINYAENRDDTLVIATADHSTGGLSIAKGQDYKWNPDAIHQMKHSGAYMTSEIADGKDPKQVVNDGYNGHFPKKQLDKVIDESKKLDKLKKESKNEGSDQVKAQQEKLQHAIQKPVDDESNTGWTTNGHTGEDVNTYAYGPEMDKFEGNKENTNTADVIFSILNR